MRLLQGMLLPAMLATIASVAGGVSAKKDEPSLERTEFKTEPRNLFYFEESQVVLMIEPENGNVWRTGNEGDKWDLVDDIDPKDKAYALIKNPYDSNVAVALGSSKKHWITYDKGESWRDFTTDEHPSRTTTPISFNAANNKKLLYSALEECMGYVCVGNTYYTDDGFEDKVAGLIQHRKMCEWAVATDLIAERDNIIEDRVLCIVEGKYGSHSPLKYRLLYSDNYFEDATEAKIDGQTMNGFASIAAVKGFLVVAAKAEGSPELALFTSIDAETWHKAEFGDHHVEESAYTLLESTNYSIQVDVQTSDWAPMGVLFSSNSEGRFFTNNVEYTNRNERGFVDFEKVSNIQGVIVVNKVKNHEEVEGLGGLFEEKKVITQLSFDDGRTFHDLKFKDKPLHLHSVTDIANSGRVFSSPAPGLIMGVGNTGEYLTDYKDGDLYVSDDGGLTWSHALDEAHKYEFGDQGSVLVAVFDEGPTKEVRYSLTHGKGKWGTIKLENELRAAELTTNVDSTSLRFILIGIEGSGRKQQWVSYTINFDDMHERDCGDEDFETWHARADEDGEPMCVMGRQQSFRRRKADAECFVKEFEKPELTWKTCECTEADYECDAGFKPEWSGEGDKKEKKCVLAGRLTPPDGKCKGDDETFMGSSGWRKIPGDECKGGTKLDEEVERECGDTKHPPSSGEISHETTIFPADNLKEYWYLERCEKCEGEDETIVMLTDSNTVYVTHDHGKSWELTKAIDDEEVVAIYPHQYVNDAVYFITPSKKVYYSKDRAKTIHEFDAPLRPQRGLQILQFHPDPNKSEWLIWTGQDKEDAAESFVTVKDGLEWTALARAVSKCQFMYNDDGHDVNEQLVYCEQHTGEDPRAALQLVSSEDWFKNKNVVFDNVVSFATMSEFIVVASRTEDGKNLKLDASIDGKTFADAQFPPKMAVVDQQAYTVLDSSTHSVFLHVTVNSEVDSEYGTIIKSNSNGTSYVLSVNEVNRNREGYVDFEKMQGLEGVAIINIISNKNEVDNGSMKKKRTLITHNDGADWALLSNVKDSDGEKNLCNDPTCSLHLHGYTERSDPRATYSSASAVGLMMGVGNVGTELSKASDANTFLTQDGGVNWRQIKEGSYMWEYGDQGSVIVLVKKDGATKNVLYSTNEGDDWEEYIFADSPWNIELITTVPSDTSMNFLLWGRETSGKNRDKLGTVNLDFSGKFSRQCELDDDKPEAGDYEFWTPRHPMQNDDCLFGHIAKYHRKKKGKDCYNGRRRFDDVHVQEKCECSRHDWECDYNYERQTDGSCALVQGLSAPDPIDVCKDKDVIEYHEITGYRKVPISNCESGQNLQAETKPCPGHEDEYNEKHGTSGFVIFLAVVIPIIGAAGIGYWVYKNWDHKFGRIRLGDGYSSFDSSSPWISWPVAAVSGLVAVLAAVPLLIGSLWRSMSGSFGGRGYGSRTYNSRASFGRGRGDYAIVDPDEGELLGENSDEDV